MLFKNWNDATGTILSSKDAHRTLPSAAGRHHIRYLSTSLEMAFTHTHTAAPSTVKHSLLLALQDIHLAQASFQLEAFGSRFVLDLSLNK